VSLRINPKTKLPLTIPKVVPASEKHADSEKSVFLMLEPLLEFLVSFVFVLIPKLTHRA
jgi:hypothetical protein